MSGVLSPTTLDQMAWEAALAGFAGASLLQSWAYGAAKVDEGGWDLERLDYREAGTLSGMAQVMVRRLPLGLGGLAWINRGPLVAAGHDPAPIFAALRRWFGRRGFYLRVAPALADQVTPPGFRPAGRPGWASALLDITPEEADLRKGLHGKWRNTLNKAEREGPAISGAETDLADFLAGYGRFLAERSVPTTVTPALLAALHRHSLEHLRPLAYVARHQDEVVGGVLMARYGKGAEYLAGYGTEAGRRLGVGQALLWRGLVDVKRRGAEFLDLGGLDPLRTPAGIRDFKEGVRGVPYRLAEELECLGPNPLARLVRRKVARSLALADGAPS
ncbi:lipid II:glycine glycyltransferase FemX [Paramagnetospirillum magneticum]|uniref:N-acetyltransferase domain-containing protein n=1 Tax=Paramagnetospirillum magneticum (strain ATCC 700264 / AMB-1) TaxID=342108 RepID=Q2WBC8_PARM1|nr:GNAT family N-acetyltransferase [Paramagnetospirillum magneticum]BAE48847.1 Uncharacterized protein amb0043 [Paramagnetospirillum magneticum AMB-1]